MIRYSGLGSPWMACYACIVYVMGKSDLHFNRRDRSNVYVIPCGDKYTVLPRSTTHPQ